MTSKAPVISNDPAHDSRAGGVPAGHQKLQAFLGMPFILEGELLGASSMGNKPGGYTDADVELFGYVAEIGGLLIAADRS
jgi:GAF domain-containing protein